jgi:Spy/CpxP family protein refolding chaperone
MRSALFAVAVAMAILAPGLARAQSEPTPQPSHTPGPMALHGPGRLHAGIPPRIAARIGVPQEVQTKIQQMAFQSNEQLIGLEADLKRAQLEMEKLLASQKPDQSAVLAQVDRVSRAEAEVRKNRIGLMLRIREALGPELWQKLQAEMPMHRKMKLLKGFGHGSHGPLGQLDFYRNGEELEIDAD